LKIKLIERIKNHSKWQTWLGALIVIVLKPQLVEWGISEDQFMWGLSAVFGMIGLQGVIDAAEMYGKAKNGG